MTSNRFLIIAAAVLVSTTTAVATATQDGWSPKQLEELRSLSLSEREPLAKDPTNRVADDPRAAALGERLFNDTRLSANGKVACGTCHQADRTFQDGLALGQGVGTTAKRTMPIADTARAPFLFWDGRKDSQWAQALGPLESAVEHGGTREQYAQVIAKEYRADYEAIFGALPSVITPDQRETITRIFVNIGKSIAAFERLVEVGPSRFDRYVDAVVNHQPTAGMLNTDEIAGLKLFVGKAKCTQCHNGPLFTNNEFHNTGVPQRAGVTGDRGRLDGARAVLKDEFNCRSQWSDARDRCTELDYMATDDHALDGAYKVPSLRNVAERWPYMDAGQFATLGDVLDHYNRAPAANGHTELKPLGLKKTELRQLEAFLRTLSGPVLVKGQPYRGESR